MNNWYLLAAIPVFGICVLIHELGHFLTAIWTGIRVEEFGIGLPPRIVGFRKRQEGGWEVIWFGGPRTVEDDYGREKQSPFSGASGGVSTPSSVPPEKHRTIYSINLLPIGGFVRMPGENGDMHDEAGRYDAGSFAAQPAHKRIIVLSAGVIMNVLLAMVLFMFAYGGGQPTFPAQIGKIVPNSPAAQAGLRADDTFITVNGQHVSQFSDVQSITSSLINQHKNASTVPIVIVARHAGQKTTFQTTVYARVHPPEGQGAMGIEEKVVFVKAPFWEAPFRGISETFNVTNQFVSTLFQMIAGTISPQISGPVGIVHVTGQVAQSVPTLGWWPILSLTAILNINLAIVNILPFPALDGGRIFLVLVELLRGGKRLKPEVEGIINLVGMAILLTLMVIITVSDVMHWNG
jgi:regulator of sigma E protease